MAIKTDHQDYQYWISSQHLPAHHLKKVVNIGANTVNKPKGTRKNSKRKTATNQTYSFLQMQTSKFQQQKNIQPEGFWRSSLSGFRTLIPLKSFRSTWRRRWKKRCLPKVRKDTHVLFKGQLGVPLAVYPWYLLCSTLGFLGIITHKYPRAIGLT